MRAPFKSFLATLKLENKSAETIRTYDKCLRKYDLWLYSTSTGKKPREPDKDNMMEFLVYMTNDEKLKPSTIKLYMIILKRYFKFIEEDFPKVKLPKIPKTRPKFIEQDDFIRMYGLTGDWYPLRAMLSTAYSTAMRIDEIVTRKWKDVDLVKKRIFVSGKTGPDTDAWLPLDNTAVRDIDKWLGERKKMGYPDMEGDDYLFHRPNAPKAMYSKSTATSQLYWLCAQAGIERRSWHKIRHSRATHLREQGVDLVNIKDLLRHKSIMTTMIYASTDTEKLRKAVDGKGVLDGKE